MSGDQAALYDLIHDNPRAQTAYNETLLISFLGSLDLESLEYAINKLISRHESLRTVFKEDNRDQVVLPALPYALTVSIAENSNQLKQWLVNQSNKLLCLYLGPLYNFSLLKLSPQHHILAITAINSLSDGISFSILTDELSIFYNKPSSTLEGAVQFSDFLSLHENLIKSNQNHVIFWENMLLKKEIKRIDFPLSKVRPEKMSFSGLHHQFNLNNSIMQQLKVFAKENRMSMFACLLGFFCLTIHRLTKQDDIIIGVPFAYRQSAEFKSSVGFCITVFPIRANLLESDTLSVYLLKIRNLTFGMFENCYVDINEILGRSNIKCDEARPLFFDALFNLERPQQQVEFNELTTHVTGLNSPYANLNIGLTNFDELKLSSAHAQFDITANLMEEGDSCSGVFEYNTDIFNSSDMEHITSIFMEMLSLVSEGGNFKLSQCLYE